MVLHPSDVLFLVFFLLFLSFTIFGEFETQSSIESIKVVCHQEEDVWVGWVFGGSAGKTGQKQETPHPQPPADLQRIIRSNKQKQIQIQNTQIQHRTKCQKDRTCGIFLKRGLFKDKNDRRNSGGMLRQKENQKWQQWQQWQQWLQ